MYLIDTNIILEYLLDRNKAGQCEDFLELVENSETTGILTVFSLHSIAVILEELEEINEYRQFLETINGFEGLYIHSLTTREEIKTCRDAGEKDFKFDDAYQYRAAKNLEIPIVSLDTDFDNTDIERKEPAEVVKEIEK